MRGDSQKVGGGGEEKRNISIKQVNEEAYKSSNLKNLGMKEALTSTRFLCKEEVSSERKEILAVTSVLERYDVQSNFSGYIRIWGRAGYF